MNYTNYSVIDFVMDEYFQQWVLHPDKESDYHWYQWLKDHPDKHYKLQEARKLILLQRFQHAAVPVGKLAEIRENIKKNTDFRPAVAMPKRSQKPVLASVSLKIAASLLLLLITGMGFYLLKFDYPRTVATGYGQIKEIILPDSSKVILNANSSVEYSSDWTAGNKREIWLRGEAYFEVAKQEAGLDTRLETPQADKPETVFTKFIVHVDGLDVEVIGTQFNVNNRDGAVKVVLNEGKVRIRANDGKQVSMVPGEMLTYSVKSKDLLKKLVDPEKHISWRNYHLIFEGEQLREIASLLETDYGVKVIFTNPDLAKKKITGILPSDSLDVILEALQTIYDIRIKKEGDKVIFQK
jgi:transmembrane sensor